MSDEANNTPDVTVNVVASLGDLEQRLKDGDNLINKFATTTSEKIVKVTVQQDTTADIDPNWAGNNRASNGRFQKKSADTTANINDSTSSGSTADIVGMVDKSVKHGSGGTGQSLPSLPDLNDKNALLEQGKLLDELLAKYEKLGIGGSYAAMVLAERISYIDAALEELVSKEPVAKEPKPPKEPRLARESAPPKPPKPEREAAPEPEPESVSMAQAARAGGNLVRLANSAGLPTGNLATLLTQSGQLSASWASMSATLAPLIPALATVAVTIGVVVVAVLAAVAAIGAIISITKQATQAAAEAELQYIKLSGALGSISKAKIAVEEVELVTAGTGVNPESILALHETLSRRAREVLLQGPGLELLVKASARLDPQSAGKFGEAIGNAYDTLRTNPAGVISNIEELNKLGLITDEAAGSLERMSRIGVNSKAVWAALYTEIHKNSEAAGNADKSFGNLMNRLGNDISSTWNQMMKAMGEGVMSSLGPTFEGLLTSIETMKPKLIDIAKTVGEYLGGIASWVSGVINWAMDSMSTLTNLFKNSELGDFVAQSLMRGFLIATNSLLNGLAFAVQYTADLFVAGFQILGSADFWGGIGDMLIGAVHSMFGALAGITSVLFDGLNPVIGWIMDVVSMVTNTLVGALMRVAASAMIPGKDRDDMWNNGGEMMDSTLEGEKKKREAAEAASVGGGMMKAIADEGKAIAKEQNDKAKGRYDSGFAGMEKAASESTGAVSLNNPRYYKPDAFTDQIDTLGKSLDEMWNRNKPSEAEAKEKDKKIEIPEMKDAFGQSGPKSVADSLQSVGGGGMAAGMSLQERMLDENKEQTKHLRKIAGDGTASISTVNTTDATSSVSGVFGGGKGEGDPNTTLLASINSTLYSILSAMISSKGSSGASGSLVTIRG